MESLVKKRIDATDTDDALCNSKLLEIIKILFLVQGFVVAASGNVGVITYNNRKDLDEIRMKELSWLTASHGYIHIVAAILFFTPACRICKIHMGKLLIVILSWSCWVTWIVIYRLGQIYICEQCLASSKSLITVLDSTYELMVIGTTCLLFATVCKTDRQKNASELLKNGKTNNILNGYDV